jgi:shikimate kinase
MRFIILVGPKHSGKTSAGKVLAGILSCGFIDLDELVAQRSGKSPRALYNEGPEVFRKAEAGALAALFESGTAEPPSSLVIASGGGLVDNPDARSLLEQNRAAGHLQIISVFLNLSAKTAWERIKTAGELPPFLKTENPQETHCSLHERRAAAYRQLASLVINADGKSPQEIAQEIADRLQGENCTLPSNSL